MKSSKNFGRWEYLRPIHLQAIESLGEIGDPKAVKPIGNFLKDILKDKHVIDLKPHSDELEYYEVSSNALREIGTDAALALLKKIEKMIKSWNNNTFK